MTEERPGRVVLLGEDHFVKAASVIGWGPNSQGVGGIHNKRGWALLRLMEERFRDGEFQPSFDRIIIAETAGSIVIAQVGDRVGLIRNYRMTGERLPFEGDAADYIKYIDENQLWEELVASLGQWRWECPRGQIPPNPDAEGNESIEDFVIKTAKMEALDEAGYEIAGARIVGRLMMDSAYFAHAQYVVHAKIKSIGDASPEETELIGGSKLHSMSEIRQLVEAGELDDGLTLGALAMCGLSL